MANEKIHEYTKTRTNLDIDGTNDFFDLDATDDGGSSYESAKLSPNEFRTWLNNTGLNIYVSDGTLTEDREVTAATFYTRWTGGDVINRMADEINSYGFAVQDSSSVERGRFGYDQATVSAIIQVGNVGGTFFETVNNTMTVNTDRLYVNSTSVGIGTATPSSDVLLDLLAPNALQADWTIYSENSDNDTLFEVRNNGVVIMGVRRDNASTFFASGQNVTAVVGDSNGGLAITNARFNGGNNTTSDNQNIFFNTRNDGGTIETVQQIFVRNRSVAAGSAYGVMVIGEAIQTENVDGFSGRTVVSTRNRHTSGAAAAVLEVEHFETSGTTTGLLVDHRGDAGAITFGILSKDVTQKWGTRIYNDFKFEHNFSQIATGDFQMRSLNNVNMLFMDAGEDAVGIGIVPDSDYTLDIGGILGVEEYTVATLPTVPAAGTGVIAVTDETGGHTVAFSDGTNWRRVQDRAIVS